MMDIPVLELSDRLKSCRDDVFETATRNGRDPASITLVLATKTRTTDEIRVAQRLGFRDFGENRAQEGAPKAQDIASVPSGHGDEFTAQPSAAQPVRWHFIGHLQSNKVRQVLQFCDIIHSVERASVVEALCKELQSERYEAKAPLDVLVQVNTSREVTKSGVTVEAAPDFVARLDEIPELRVTGLMTLAAPSHDEASARAEFATLRTLADDIRAQNLPSTTMSHLSMGMSNDYRWAIAEGSTMVRVGSAAFGPRG